MLTGVLHCQLVNIISTPEDTTIQFSNKKTCSQNMTNGAAPGGDHPARKMNILDSSPLSEREHDV